MPPCDPSTEKRREARQESQKDQNQQDQNAANATPARPDPMERMQRRADAMSKSATAFKALTDAAAPLYQSLDEAQKRRFTFLIRPQRQQMKKREETLSSIRRGDQVVMGGGIVAKVTKVIDDKELEVEIADGVKVRAMRQYVAEVRVKGEPVKTETAA